VRNAGGRARVPDSSTSGSKALEVWPLAAEEQRVGIAVSVSRNNDNLAVENGPNRLHVMRQSPGRTAANA